MRHPLALLACLLVVAPAQAQRSDGPEAAAAPPGAEASADDRPSAALLTEARRLYGELEYDRVIPLTKAVLARGDLTSDLQLEAYLLQGSSLAIVGDPIDAESPFRLIFRVDPSFDLPPDTPPKILQVFRKVQVEERQIRETEMQLKIERIAQELEIRGEDPGTGAGPLEGGLPLRFNYSLKDPTGAVDAVRVQYRKRGDAAFSALALRRDADGDWTGAIPGEFTANEDGLAIELYLVVEGLGRELKQRGSAETPLVVEVGPGTAERAPPPPLPLWSFMGAATGTAALAAATVALGGLGAAAQVEYWVTVGKMPFLAAAPPEIDGALLTQKALVGNVLFVSFYVALASTVVAGAGLLVMGLFTNWSGEEEVAY